MLKTEKLNFLKWYKDSYRAVSRKVDYSSLDPSKLEDGKYYLNKEFSNGNYQIKALKMQDTTKGAAKNWSEGLERKIGTVRMVDGLQETGSESFNTVVNEMKLIDDDVGFDVQLVHSNSQWVEDTHIRRHDGSIYIPNTSENFNKEVNDSDTIDSIINRRSGFTYNAQGAIAQKDSGNEYAKTVPQSDRQTGESYLEGGNVLNTLKSDGKPGAGSRR